MSDPIDLTDQVQEICRRLKVDYGLVAEITLRPANAQVRQLKRNARGSNYIDQETGEMADDLLTFEIRS